jgi:hypothetical protein
MKKMFIVALIVSAALVSACGKKKNANTTPTGGSAEMGSAAGSGDMGSGAGSAAGSGSGM